MPTIDEQIQYHREELAKLSQLQRADQLEERRQRIARLEIGSCYATRLWPEDKFVAILTGITEERRVILSWFHIRDNEAVEMASDFRLAPGDFFGVYYPISREKFDAVYDHASRLAWRAVDSVSELTE